MKLIPGEEPELPSPDLELMREVNHATGNLVHRMFYWAELLAEKPPADDLAQTVAQLKGSLADLHRLVTRTFDLVRSVEIRSVSVSAADLVRSVALHLGTEVDFGDAPQLEQDLAQHQVSADPLVVDRAVGLLVEGLRGSGEGVEGASVSPLRVRITAPVDGVGEPRSGVLLHCSAARVTHSLPQPAREVTEAVSLALARKLLVALGWIMDIGEVNGERRVAILVPLSSSRDVTTCLSLS